MGEVTSFRNKPRARAESPPPEGSGQILFFLGVRYERQRDGLEGEAGADGAPRGSGGTRARRRKRA